MKFRIPEHGTRRTRRRFAILPTLLGDSYVWLEFYEEVEEFRRVFSDHHGYWARVLHRSLSS